VLEVGCAILFAVFLWWAGTGAILFLDGLPRRTYAASMAAMTVLAVAALAALWLVRDQLSNGAVVIGFTAALTLWAWNEMAFLMGFVTGPRKSAATPGVRGWARFRQSAATLISHEIAIAATAVAVWLIVRDSANHFGLWTFAVLWVMRLSTKINIFLGAPNVTVEFLPPHLSYLATYFRKRPMNGFFPLSITLSTLAAAWLAHLALRPGLDAGEVLGYSLLAALMALAVLEHWLLFVPVPAARLWSWSLRSHGATALAAARSDLHTPTQPPIRRNG
jgi:putative photosynthetic complex assembly protein 2